MQRVEPFGSSTNHTVRGVSLLHPEESIYEGMISGWEMQQIGGRNLKADSVKNVVRSIRRFHKFADEYPWNWSAALFDAWMGDLVSIGLAPSTIRGHQQAVRTFCDYICSPHYGWAAECEAHFRTHPVQVCHEWNTLHHLQDYEGNPRRRPMTRDELQLLFDRADHEVSQRLDLGKKGATTAWRDAALLKVVYGWGLRANEAVHLELTDFYTNPKAPQFGRYGMLQVRMGKSSRGGQPKRRSVVTLRPWAVEAVKDYVENVWPLVRNPESNALWLSERGTRLRTRELEERFAEYRDELGFDRILSPHAMRHSYVTHLIEEGHDPKFVQEQVGHAYAASTAIYTAVSPAHANKMMTAALNLALPLAGLGKKK
jgi:site-specific recombinase XerD